MAGVRQLQLQCLLYLTLISLLSAADFVTSTTINMSLPGCPDKCGNMTVPYPFGFLPGCYRDGFDITCNESTTPPKPFLNNSNIDLLDINITTAEARILQFMGYDCYNKTSRWNFDPYLVIQATNTFLFSNRRNKFTVIGCYTLAYIVNPKGNTYQSGCSSFCENLQSTTGDGGTCNGRGCCQTPIPEGLNYYEVQWGFNGSNTWSFNPCQYAALVQEDWYNFTVNDLVGNEFYERNNKKLPMVLDWAIRDNGTCIRNVEYSSNPACLSEHSRCDNTTNGEGYICKCLPGYEGNPYLREGCRDIDECQLPDVYHCTGTCSNTDGSYDCDCPKGKQGNGKAGNCTNIPEKFPYPARVAIYSILCVAIFSGLCVLLVWCQQHRRHMKEKEEYKKYYQMMDNHLHVYSQKQIENATNNYCETNILGRGGQGNVYKGLIENNQVVAIKKAKEVEETQRGEFVNEIILLSQINHKNVVRLLGCCLEVKIPMLVYEFVPNGTLFDLLHTKSRSRRSISLGTRLKIALDSAVALDYLHSSIFRSIIHGDVKSANILLDADYTAKVSDFGASSVVPVNEIVELVHFSHGYLDPECLYTQILTKNSDVYSFGVVMLELITRKGAVYTDENGEKQPLATSFLSKARKNEHHEMFDVELANEENVMEILDEISEIALQCLSPKGEDRPTMRQVVEELHKLVRLHNTLPGRQIDEEEMESLLGETKFLSISDTSGFNSTQYSAVLEINTGAPR
ncbi:wall-associated receptor kinase 2-like [Carex rostrata]